MEENENNQMKIFYFPKCLKCNCIIIQLDLALTFDCNCNKKGLYDNSVDFLSRKNNEDLFYYLNIIEEGFLIYIINYFSEEI